MSLIVISRIVLMSIIIDMYPHGLFGSRKPKELSSTVNSILLNSFH
ncbi:MAG: hypothetical protein QW607_10370 [Desulfurococcaceae archaeon]